ncbi:inositol monophosphatase [Ectothiorhodospiraceae bacterium 2226]|nr:inositol monophosphatase [Ectothiorhodospiraceae bacterium 2226]
MKTLPDLATVVEVVRDIARREILPRAQDVRSTRKADGSLVTEADHAVQAALQAELHRRWPEVALLGEEMACEEQAGLIQHSASALWCLDPLDGTSNFAVGLPFFCTSLALLHEGEVVQGVVYDPLRDECYAAEKGRGASLNGVRLGTVRPASPLRGGVGLVDLKRLPRALAERLVREPPYASQRSLGSVALDWCWVAAGRVHVYLHGKQKLWDYAAGELILREAGGHSATLDGESVSRPSLAPRSSVAALDEALFQEWAAWLGVPGHQRG